MSRRSAYPVGKVDVDAVQDTPKDMGQIELV